MSWEKKHAESWIVAVVVAICGLLQPWSFKNAAICQPLFFVGFWGAGEACAAEPIANAGGAVVSQSKDNLLSAILQLDGSSSYDPDSDALTYHWYGPFSTVSGSSSRGAVPIVEGIYTVSLAVDDGSSLSALSTKQVTIRPCFSITARTKSGKIQLTWPSVAGAKNYEIFRAQESDPFKFDKIGSTTSTYATYLDLAVTDEITYLYAVGALMGTGSCYSNVVAAHPPSRRTTVSSNYAPVIYSSPISNGTVGVIYNYDVNALDPNGDALSYKLKLSPADMIIDSKTGLISWTPLGAGVYEAAVEVSDTKGAKISQLLTVTVEETVIGNKRPIAAAGPDQVHMLAFGQAEIDIKLNASASSDPDGNVVAYAWTGTPAPENVVSPTVRLKAGTHTFSLIVTDEKGTLSQPDSVAITINEATVGGPPAISLSAASYVVAEGGTLKIDVSAADPDADPVTIAALPRLVNSSFTATPGTTAAGAFTFSPDYTQQGIYNVSFTARDTTGLVDCENIQIVVTDVNRPPAVNVPLSFSVKEGELLTTSIEAQDPDGDALSVTVDSLPANAFFIGSTRTLIFTPDFDQAGSYQISCRASDGKTSEVKNVSITVTDAAPGTGGRLELKLNPIESPTFLAKARVTGSVNAALPEVARISSVLISGLSPAAGLQGQTIDVVISGKRSAPYETHFAQGLTSADFGTGITVNSVTVTGQADATVNVTISPKAAPGVRVVKLTTDAEVALSVIGFDVSQGVTQVTGRIVDPETGKPVLGAVVTMAGTGLSATTDLNGIFTINGAPAGRSTLLVNAANHELMVIGVNPTVGETANIGDASPRATVFNPVAPPSATMPSIVGRGLCQLQFSGGLEKAQALIRDTIIAVGGSDFGVLDEYGNQLNPSVSGDGIASLKQMGVQDIAQRWQMGETRPLGNMLLSMIHMLTWKNGKAPSLYALLASIQMVVDDAWTDPYAPSSIFIVTLFNTRTGGVSPTPPVISADTPLNPLRAYLLSSTILGYVSNEMSLGQLGALDGRGTGGSSGMKAFLASLWSDVLSLVGPSSAHAEAPPKESPITTWSVIFENLAKTSQSVVNGVAFDIANNKISGLGEDALSLLTPLSTINSSSKTAAVDMWVDFMHTLPQNSSVGSITAKLVNHPDDMLLAFAESKKAAVIVDQLPKYANAASGIAKDALGNVAGQLAEVILKQILTNSIIDGIIEGTRPDAPIIDGAYLTSADDGGMQNVRLVFRPAYDEIRAAQADSSTLFYYAIYRQNAKQGQPEQLIAVAPSYRFYKPLSDLEEKSGRSRMHAVLKSQSDSLRYVFVDTTAKPGTNVYKIVTRIMRGKTVPNPPWTPPEQKMALDLILSKAGPGAEVTMSVFFFATESLLRIYQGIIYQVSDFSVPELIYVGAAGDHAFPRVDIARSDMTGEVFISIPVVNSIYRWTPEGLNLKAVAGFKTPYQVGLAADAFGNLFTDNKASDLQFGGRIFRFSQTDGSRALVGSTNYYSPLLQYAKAADVRAMTYGRDGKQEFLYLAEGTENRITRLDLRDGKTIDSISDRNVSQNMVAGANTPFSFQGNSHLHFRESDATLFLTQGNELIAIKPGQAVKAFSDDYDPFKTSWLTGISGDEIGNVYVSDMFSGNVTMIPVWMASASAPPGGTFNLLEDFKKRYTVIRGLVAPQDIVVNGGDREIFALDAQGVHRLQFGVSGRIWDAQNNSYLAGATLIVDDFVAGTTDAQGYFTAQGLSQSGQVKLTIQALDGRVQTRSLHIRALGPTVFDNDFNFAPDPVPAPNNIDIAAGEVQMVNQPEPFSATEMVTSDQVGRTVQKHFILPKPAIVPNLALVQQLELPEPPPPDRQPRAINSLAPEEIPSLPPVDRAAAQDREIVPIKVRFLSYQHNLKAARAEADVYNPVSDLKGVVLTPIMPAAQNPVRVSIRIDGQEKEVALDNGTFGLAAADLSGLKDGFNIVAAKAIAPAAPDPNTIIANEPVRIALPVGRYGQPLTQASAAKSQAASSTGIEKQAAVQGNDFSWNTPAPAAMSKTTEGIGFVGLVAQAGDPRERPVVLPGVRVYAYVDDPAIQTPEAAKAAALAAAETDDAGFYSLIVPAEALQAQEGRAPDPFDRGSINPTQIKIMVDPAQPRKPDLRMP